MSAIPVFIPYRNRPDLLEKAVASVPRRMTTEPIVLNNSGHPIDIRATVIEPPVPLSFTQTQNFMLKLAKERRWPFYMWMHCDAEAGPDTVDQLYKMAMSQCLSNPKWAVIYTHYDIFCAYSTAAFDAVGGYDTNFFDYASDCDVYRRLRLAGYELLESGLPVKHEGSATLKSDAFENFRVGVQVDYRTHYYTAKWGGNTGEEKYMQPWNGRFNGQA